LYVLPLAMKVMRFSKDISLWIIAGLSPLLTLMSWLLLRDVFEYTFPKAFYLLFLSIPAALLYMRMRDRSDLPMHSPASSLFVSGNILWSWVVGLPFLLRTGVFICVVFVLARPQSKTSIENLTREGIDIVLSLDVSGSMLSMDFKPNRLEVSRDVAMEFVSERPFDRIGIVSYEGQSFTQVPLTSDHRVVNNSLKSLNTGMLESGTAIGMGLATAVSRLKNSEAISKVIILLTDGVNNAGQVKPLDAARIAEAFGIRVYTIGIGTMGRAQSPVRQLPDGSYVFEMVEVQIDEDVLKEISAITGGRYFRATSAGKLREIYKEIDELEKTKFNVSQFHNKTEEYLSFAFSALLLLLVEWIARHTLLRNVV